MALREHGVFDAMYRMRDAGDGWRHVHVRGLPVLEDGEPLEWIGVVNDITEQVLTEETLRRTALEDALTGLPNRAHLVDRLTTALARREPSAAVIYIDVDHFKSVNDRFGHEGGDRLLTCIACRSTRSRSTARS